LPVTALWGVGAKTAESLHRLGIRSVGDLAATPVEALKRSVGTSVADHLSALANGIDPRPVDPAQVEKSISAEHTLNEDLTTEAGVLHELLGLAGEVARQVRSRGWVARTIGIKIRFADFSTVTRVRTLPTRTDSSGTIYDTAVELYRSLDLDKPRVRLVGVKCEGLLPAVEVAEQLSFDDLAAAPSTRATDAVMDAARAKFGDGAIRYASLVSRPGSPPPEPRDIPSRTEKPDFG
jgi:DNA polymerase-4